MSDNAEPVLTAEEWEQMCVPYTGEVYADRIASILREPGWYARMPVILALANAALPDDDPRKITRERIERMRDMAEVFAGESVGWKDEPEYLLAIAFADALESYLPPVIVP